MGGRPRAQPWCGWRASRSRVHRAAACIMQPRASRSRTTVLPGCGTPAGLCGCRPATPLACRSTPTGPACAARTCTWRCCACGRPGWSPCRRPQGAQSRSAPSVEGFAAGSPPSPTPWLRCRGHRPGSSTWNRGRSSACPAS